MTELEAIGDVLLYLDDGLVVVENEQELRAALNIIDSHLMGLGLELHREKTVICQLDSKTTASSTWQYLGFQMRRGRPIPTQSKCDDLVAKLAKKAHKGGDADDIAAVIAGWAGYFATTGAEEILRRLDRRISAWVGYLGPLPRLEKLIGTRASSGSRGPRAGGRKSTRAYRKGHFGGSGESLVDSELKIENQLEGYHFSLREFLTKEPGDAHGNVAVAGAVGGDSVSYGTVPPIAVSGGKR